MTAAVPIAEGLFTWPSAQPRLTGSTCGECGTTTFPRQASCPKCTAVAMEDHELAARGTLWSFTVQGFPPKEPYGGPDEFEPYGVGYVELPGEVIVESILTENDPEKLAIGMPMEVRVVPFRVEADGTEVVTFAFSPVPAAVTR